MSRNPRPFHETNFRHKPEYLIIPAEEVLCQSAAHRETPRFCAQNRSQSREAFSQSSLRNFHFVYVDDR
jgi:hypothetical protein